MKDVLILVRIIAVLLADTVVLLVKKIIQFFKKTLLFGIRQSGRSYRRPQASLETSEGLSEKTL